MTSSNSVQNAVGQQTEVLGGVIAEQTKQLLKNEFEYEFGAMSTINSGGRRFIVGSIAATGCFNKKNDDHFKESAFQREAFIEDAKAIVDTLSAKDAKLSDLKVVISDAKTELGIENEGALKSLIPTESISINDAKNLTILSHFLVNKDLEPYPQSSLASGRANAKAKKADRYQKLTRMITDTLNEKISERIELDSDGLEGVDSSELLKMGQLIANNEDRITANNLKTPKGRTAELLEISYRKISLKLKQLEDLQHQQKMLTVMAINKLDAMHSELLGDKP